MESVCFQGQESSISYCNMKTPELTILNIRVRNCQNLKGTATLDNYISINAANFKIEAAAK